MPPRKIFRKSMKGKIILPIKIFPPQNNLLSKILPARRSEEMLNKMSEKHQRASNKPESIKLISLLIKRDQILTEDLSKRMTADWVNPHLLR